MTGPFVSPSTSRRSVLKAAASSLALRALPGLAQPATSSHWVLIGTHDGEGIYRATWNSETGSLGSPELAVATPRPTWLTRHPRLPVVYACNEMDGDNDSAASAFALANSGTPSLRLLSKQGTGGGAPCHAVADVRVATLFTANYTGGSLSAFPLASDGALQPRKALFQCKGNPVCGTTGPNHDRQDAAHLHCTVLSPDGRYLLACDLGDDSILIFPVGARASQPLGPPQRVAVPAGSGPRHLAFHPNGKLLYCIHELGVFITTWRWQPGAKAPLVSTGTAPESVLPTGVRQDALSTGAEIRITHDGRFLYTSTRGADMLCVFTVEGATGNLHLLQQLPCGGKKPRFFALDPSERWLLCANQDSNDISIFAREAASGRLSPHTLTKAPNPECLLWV